MRTILYYTSWFTAAAAPPAAVALALVNTDALINYNTPAGAKLYERAIKPLSANNLYDLSSDRLTVFLADLDDRIMASGWEGIFSIPGDVAAAVPNLRMLTTDYSVVTLGQINDHAETYPTYAGATNGVGGKQIQCPKAVRTLATGQ